MERLIDDKGRYLSYKTINTNFFKVWSEEMAYVFGYWFADGCISHGAFSIVSTDYDVLEKITNAMKSTYKIQCYQPPEGKGIFKAKRKITYKISISNKEVVNDIKNLGGCERKSLTAEFPYVPDEYLRHFIRGFFDGDGCIKLRNCGNPELIFCGTKIFLTELQNRIGYCGRLVPHMNIYNLNYFSEDSQSILKFMYDDSNIYLNRKYELYKKAMVWKRKNFRWTNEEIDILKSIGKGKIIDVLSLLPNRNRGALYKKYEDLVCKSEICVEK